MSDNKEIPVTILGNGIAAINPVKTEKIELDPDTTVEVTHVNVPYEEGEYDGSSI